MRASVRSAPTDRIENYFVGYQSKSEDNGTGFIFSGAGPGMNVANLSGNLAYNITNPDIFDPTITQDVLAAQKRLGARKTAMNQDQYTEIETEGYFNTTSIELSDNLRFRNILAYQTMQVNYSWDLDGSILPMLGQLDPVGAENTPVANDPFSRPGQRGSITDQSLLTEECNSQEPCSTSNWISSPASTIRSRSRTASTPSARSMRPAIAPAPAPRSRPPARPYTPRARCSSASFPSRSKSSA